MYGYVGYMREVFGVQSRVSGLLAPRMGYVRDVRVDYGTQEMWLFGALSFRGVVDVQLFGVFRCVGDMWLIEV